MHKTERYIGANPINQVNEFGMQGAKKPEAVRHRAFLGSFQQVSNFIGACRCSSAGCKFRQNLCRKSFVEKAVQVDVACCLAA